MPPSRRSRILPLVLAAASLAADAPRAFAADANATEWKLVSRSEKLSVFSHPNTDPTVQEVKAVGLIKAPPSIVRRVLEDTAAYPAFMPYVVETRTLARETGAITVYQRLSPPLTKDLDYTMRMRAEPARESAGDKGLRICMDTAAHPAVEEKKGIVRLKVLQGHWLLEPSGNGGETRLTYWLRSDCGRAMSPRVASLANRFTIPEMFEGIGRQAKLAKYSRE